MRAAGLVSSLALLACTAREVRPTPVPASDPRVAVTEWSQVERFHCARGSDGAVRRCTADADCGDGAVCDTSTGCGCCVPPPPRLEPSATLHRYVYGACNAGRCTPPRFCEPTGDGDACVMRFPQEVPLWVTPWAPAAQGDAIADARRELCIKVEPGQDCLWAFDLAPGEYTADAPYPTRYTGSYECGGRTCNGATAVRASPRVGSSFTARVIARHCGS